jgi:hypothetical protein
MFVWFVWATGSGPVQGLVSKQLKTSWRDGRDDVRLSTDRPPDLQFCGA